MRLQTRSRAGSIVLLLTPEKPRLQRAGMRLSLDSSKNAPLLLSWVAPGASLCREGVIGMQGLASLSKLCQLPEVRNVRP